MANSHSKKPRNPDSPARQPRSPEKLARGALAHGSGFSGSRDMDHDDGNGGDDNDRLLTTQEAADFLNVSVSWLAKARMTGEGPPFVKMVKTVRYRKSVLREYVRTRMRRSTSDTGARRPGRPSRFDLVAPILVTLFDINGWATPPAVQILKREVDRQLSKPLREEALEQILRRLWEKTQEPRFRR